MQMQRRGWFTLAACFYLVAAAAAARAETLTDNFNAVGNPDGSNDYNLNAELDVRQAGSLAPATYTRIGGGANLVQVNNNTPDSFGPETGLGKMDFFNLGYSAVHLDAIPAGHSLSLAVEATPVTNHAPMDLTSWICINVGASGGNGFPVNGNSGVSMLVRDNGGYQVFVGGGLIADGSVAAAGTYLVEIALNATGDRYSLRVAGTDVLVDAAVTSTGRLIQFGATNDVTPTGQPFTMHTLDNLSITTTPEPVIPCFTADPLNGVAPLNVSFDASCTTVAGTVDTYTWDFGDLSGGTGAMVQHSYGAGTHTATLTVEDTDGNSASTQATIRVYQPAASYSDDFERDPGPVGGWTPSLGAWNIAAGKLVTGPTAGGEHWVWAGDPNLSFPANATYSFEYSFLSPGTNPDVGRHGGVMFCANIPTNRSDGAIHGYTLDWIDRVDDHGLRLIRVDNGIQTGLAIGTPALADPPTRWRIQIDGDRIQCFGDDAPIFDVVDDTYRGGLLGLWCWDGGQLICVDNVSVTSPSLAACFTATPESTVFPDATFEFDASCSQVTGATITAYEWAFGDGMTGTGAVVQHTYAFVDTYTVTLTVRNNLGDTAEVSRNVSVVPELVPFAECFDRPAGPVDGWTVGAGAWNITESGQLNTMTAGAEHWVWAGDPPRPSIGEFVAEVDFQFAAIPADGIGRHGGIAFCASVATTRADVGFQGYTIDWIDRAEDHGYRLLRWNAGFSDVIELVPAVEPNPDPGRRWRVEIDGDVIRLAVDGAPILEATDAAYRRGYFGAWAWVNGQDVHVDNLFIPPSDACTIDVDCPINQDEDSFQYTVTASSGGGTCPSAEECCTRFETFLDGVSMGVSELGPGPYEFSTTGCAPGTQHELRVRCVEGIGAGAEDTCTFTCPGEGGVGPFLRGDCNQDGTNTGQVTDGVFLLNFLFQGGLEPLCLAACDFNGDGAVPGSPTDAVYYFNFNFLGGTPMPEPLRDCALSSTPGDVALGCETPRGCMP